MQKDFEGIVKVYYQGQTMTGYLQLTKDIQTIHVKVEEQELLETFKNNLNETFVFHCKKMKSGGWISLFECQLQKFHASDENEAEVIFRPGIYIDNSFELQATDLQDIKLFGLTASYTQLHLLFQGLNTQEEIKGRFHHHNNEIIFKIKLGSWERGTLFEEIKQPRVLVTFRTKKSVGFHYLEDLFFRFTTMVSFLANHFTPVEHFSYKNKHAYTKGMSKIFYSSREENMFLQKPKITQYLHRLQPNSNEIKQAIIDPMISKNFKLWMHFVSTFRFKHQSLEDKFLSYYRCLESLGTHHNGGNQKYASEELNHLIENLDTALLQSDFVFSLEDIDHIKKSTRGGNAKPAGDAIQQLIKKELHVERVEMENYEEDVKPFVNRLKDLRDRLSHGRSYTLKEKDNERIMKLKEIVQELLLKELGFNLAPQTYDFEAPPKASIRNVKESIKQLREKEQRQIKNGGYLLSFEEEKEQIEKMEEEQ